MPTHRPFSAQLSCCALPSLRGAPACERTGSHVRRLGGVGGWAWARERWSTGFSRPRRTCLCPRDSAVRWEVARARGPAGITAGMRRESGNRQNSCGTVPVQADIATPSLLAPAAP